MARLTQKVKLIVVLFVLFCAARIIWLLVKEDHPVTGKTDAVDVNSPEGNAIRAGYLCRQKSVRNQSLPAQALQQQDLQHFLMNGEYKIAYCFTPIVASTFWKKIMFLLNQNRSNQDLKSLVQQFTDLSNHHIHMTSGLPWLLHSFTDLSKAHEFLSRARSIMFVCSPYRRLFATYVNKFFLPAFWRYAGISVVKRIRPNPSEKSKKCGYDVTFREFVEYVVTEDGSHSDGIEASVKDHWQPISTTCQPCRFHYQQIGKVENFYNDINFISNKLNIENFDLSKFIYKTLTLTVIKQHIRDSIQMATSVVQQPSPCVNEKRILDRLWRSFKLRGFVRGQEKFALTMLQGNDPMSRLRSFELLSLAKASQMDRDEGERQQIEYMVTAYSSVPRILLNKIKQVFHDDFMLFGYEEEPIEIYSALKALH